MANNDSRTEAPPTPSPPPLHVRAAQIVLDTANGTHPLSNYVPRVLWVLDAILCVLIIWKVPYTEIDWVAYMEQVSQFLAGERNYPAIKGSTGPLVYPAAHVYTYTVLYWLTDEGRNIFRAQQLFAVIYMFTLAVVMACYRRAGAPPYIFPLLILSKRLHSVFVLRCFNDCFAALAMWLTIFFLQHRYWTPATLAYSWGLATKMSQLLVLPALGAVLFLGRGYQGALRMAGLVAQSQFLVALPFVTRNAKGYLSRAFELSRVFKYEWTVNWRMAGEAAFLGKPFAYALLGLHAAALYAFLANRWLRPTGRSPAGLALPMLRGESPFSPREERLLAVRVTPDYVLTSMLTANVVGLLFARSLHYQFYAYLAWSTPFLLWRATGSPLVVYGLWAAQEWAWNVFPSTALSSTVVVCAMAITVGLVWSATARDDVPPLPPRLPDVPAAAAVATSSPVASASAASARARAPRTGRDAGKKAIAR